MARVPKIGLSANFFHADFERPIYKGKTLLYFEQSMAQYLMDRSCLPVLLPTPTKSVSYKNLIESVDALLLSGGADVSPLSYGEEVMREEWAGDRIRDEYEMALAKEALQQDRPVLAICRGIQVLNVALGGSLYQDINTQLPGTLVHRDWDHYCQNRHEAEILAGSTLASLYPGKGKVAINSIHHQALKDLGKGLVVQARSLPDGIIEAVCLEQSSPSDPWCFGVQWHPEFQTEEDQDLLDPLPLLNSFFEAIEARI